ncbi:MAG TPA: roadblock/LC7 domain-containing protein [Thermoplasmata archaeon]|nr:roadblock/LC7 domain-containing protein [Thermoplasmata archaeon]
MPRAEVEERHEAVDIPTELGLEDQLEQILLQLRRRARGVRGSVIADANGLAVAADIRLGMSSSVLSAMSTLIAQSAGSVFDTLSLPNANFVLMEGPAGNVAVTTLTEGDLSLLALAEKSTNLGILKIEMKRAAHAVAEALGLAFGGRATITELFLLHRDGLLIRHYSDALRTDIDRDILGGMLVGVQDFVKQTLASKEGTLDQMRYGDYTIFFVRGNNVIAAAVASEGDAESVQYQVMDALQEFEDKYRGTLGNWSGDTNAFPGIDKCFEKVLRA